MAADIHSKVSASTSFNGLFDTGILTFMWAKVSEFVMKKDMQVKLHIDAAVAKASETTSALSAKISRPTTMAEFSEMLNLWIMYLHGLGICNVLTLAQFLEHCVYDTIRYRNETWQFAHELMLVMFRRIEDSGGRLTLANTLDESYLNTVMEEARVNYKAFFRSPGGNPGTVGKEWNKKFNKATRLPCTAFNFGIPHEQDALKPDGSCKYNHVCDHWVTNKGKNGRCLSADHGRVECNNAHKCSDAVEA